MKTTILNTEVSLDYSFERMGRGHYKVVCEAEFLNQKNRYTAVTTDSQFIDDLSECETYDEKQAMFLERFDFEDPISEDIYFLNFKN